MAENDEEFYARRAKQALGLAAAADDPAVKAIHLNLAARYATQRERAARGERFAPQVVGDK